MAKAAKLRAGDVLKVESPNGIAYLSYVGRHETLGDSVWVVPQMFTAQPVNVCEAFMGEGYHAFYPAHAAIRQGLVQLIGYCVEALRQPPAKVRQAINVDRDGTVRSWLITDGISETPRRDLAPEEEALPIASIWNHGLLIERIVQGWRPRDGLRGPLGRGI